MDASEMIAEARSLVNDSANDFFDDAMMLEHLNRALRDVTSRSRSIREVIYYPVNEGQSVYGLPEGFLGNDKFSWLYKGYWYPLHRRSLSSIEYVNNSNIITSWRPFYFDIWGKVRKEKIVSNVEAVSADGGIFTDNGFPTNDETFGFKFQDGLKGIDDIRVRDFIINMSDKVAETDAGARGFVTERKNIGKGLALFAYARLEGGAREGDDRGKIFADDFIRITTPNVVSHAVRLSPPPTTSSEEGRELLWVYMSRKHYEVKQEHIDEFNDGLELDVELETPALELLVYYMRRTELGADDSETMAQRSIYETEYHKALPKIRQRIREHESTWGKPLPYAALQNLELSGISTPSAHPFNTHDIL